MSNKSESEIRRDLALEEGSLRPGFQNKQNYPGYKSKQAKESMRGGYRKGDEIHHIMTAVEMGAPFLDNLNAEDRLTMIRYANSIGIRFANDPANLVAATEEVHRGAGPNSMHGMLGDMQLDTSVGMNDYETQRDVQEVGRMAVKNFHKKLGQLPLDARKQALSLYAEYVYDPMVEKLVNAGHPINTREQNMKLWDQEVRAEAQQELGFHVDEKKKFSHKKLDRLLKF